MVPLALASDGTEPSRYRTLPGDVIRFHNIEISDGRPYRDFEVEYPPVMLAAIEAVDGGNVRSTTVRLMWSQLVVDLAIAAVVAWAWGRRAGIAYLVIGLPFLLYPFIGGRWARSWASAWRERRPGSRGEVSTARSRS